MTQPNDKPDTAPSVEEARADFEEQSQREAAAEHVSPHERTLNAARRVMDKYAEALAELAR